MADDNSLYFRQLLSGRDHAITHSVAGQMANFAYLVGCPKRRECLAVDPTWDPHGVVAEAEKDGMRVVGGVATHSHVDHVGGTMMGIYIPGFRELAELVEGPLYVHSKEADRFMSQTALGEDRLAICRDGDVIEVGEVRVEVIHTPGHSPGGICLLFNGHVITGDVLFVGGSGRTDLPGADVTKMYHSLKRLGALDDETLVWPGHHYGHAEHSTIGEENRQNPVMGVPSLNEWVRMMRG